MNIKKRKIWISCLGIFLFLILLINCKKKSPTTPNGDSSLTFSGTISLNGQPFAGVNVYLSGGASQRTTTAADGKFTFSNLLGGTYLITPSRMNYQFNPSSFDVGGQSRTDLNVTAGDAVFGSRARGHRRDRPRLGRGAKRIHGAVHGSGLRDQQLG